MLHTTRAELTKNWQQATTTRAKDLENASRIHGVRKCTSGNVEKMRTAANRFREITHVRRPRTFGSKRPSYRRRPALVY